MEVVPKPLVSSGEVDMLWLLCEISAQKMLQSLYSALKCIYAEGFEDSEEEQ